MEAVNLNSPGQVVIAGNKEAVERGMNLAKEKGAKRALALPVSVPSHCALMKPAAKELASYLIDVQVNKPLIPVLHNSDVLAYSDAEMINGLKLCNIYMQMALRILQNVDQVRCLQV